MSRNLEAAQILAKARDVIHERGWHQCGYENPRTGAVCLLGAINVAAFGTARVPQGSVSRAGWDLSRAAELAVLRVLNPDGESDRGIGFYNDQSAWTAEDALLALKQAQHLLETQEVDL